MKRFKVLIISPFFLSAIGYGIARAEGEKNSFEGDYSAPVSCAGEFFRAETTDQCNKLNLENAIKVIYFKNEVYKVYIETVEPVLNRPESEGGALQIYSCNLNAYARESGNNLILFNEFSDTPTDERQPPISGFFIKFDQNHLSFQIDENKFHEQEYCGTYASFGVEGFSKKQREQGTEKR